MTFRDELFLKISRSLPGVFSDFFSVTNIITSNGKTQQHIHQIRVSVGVPGEVGEIAVMLEDECAPQGTRFKLFNIIMLLVAFLQIISCFNCNTFVELLYAPFLCLSVKHWLIVLFVLI